VQRWSALRPDGWARYVEGFHRDRPGITESLLTRAVDTDGTSPYGWLTETVTSGERVLDIGCGSGPTEPLIDRWVGLDSSIPELRRAHAMGRMPIVAARADALPLPDSCMPSALASMSLMVVDDPAACLAELARVLEPNGRLVMLVPGNGPLTFADRVRYALLLAVLGRAAMPFPRPAVVRDPLAVLDAAGFETIGDERRRFSFSIATRDDADLFVDSLYLPAVSPRRIGAARSLVRSWRTRTIGIPLRRVGARRADASARSS
jgi:SAM-dependent methyltransferase